MINLGYLILGGSALKACYVLFNEEHSMKLPHFIVIEGLVCILFAVLTPHLSSLRIWLGCSTVLSLIYIIVACVLATKDGMNAPPRDYTIHWKSTTNRVFSTIGASANLVFAFNTGMLPEIQIFASPAYEYLDTKFEVTGSSFKVKNIIFRLIARGSYLTVSTLVSALLPFLGDFETLTGALSTFPLTFILANHMYLVAKKHKLSSLQQFWHWLNVGFFGLMSLAATIAGIRLVAVDSKAYHIFADV